MSTSNQPGPDPIVDREVPEGYRLQWVEEDREDWRLATEEEHEHRKCRRGGCKRKPVAALLRGYGTSRPRHWWLYCDWHLYGRIIKDGKIYFRRAVAIEEEVPA